MSVSSPVMDCDEATFNRIVDSPEVERICKLIAAEPDHKRQGELKRRQPFFCFHASFRGKRRVAKDAIPSGLAMIDVDGIEDPRRLWEEIEPRKEELNIMLAHVTPSGRGLRIVARTQPTAPLHLPRGGESLDTNEIDLKVAAQRIVETQEWIVRELNLTNVDCVVKDLARCSFAVPRAYILYLNNKLFEDISVPQIPQIDTDKQQESVKICEIRGKEEKEDVMCGSYNGIKYKDIISRWLALYLRQKPGYRTFEAPAEGDRNNTLYDLCRDLRNICDFSFQKMMDVVPSFGLEMAEIEQTVLSALKAERNVPYLLNRVLRKMSEGAVQADIRNADELMMNEAYMERMPVLPPMMRAVMNGAEEKYHMPILVGMLPMLCSYADKVVFRYADGRWRRPNMMSFIIGPPMSGKSAVTSQLAPLMEQMKRESKEVRDMQDEARKNNNERSDNERGKTFAAFIKKLNMDITDAELLYNQKAAMKAGKDVKGHFLPRKQFMFTEEAGVVLKAAKNDKLTSAWRCAFDNGEWGKDVHSDNAVSGEVNLSFDFTALCTMGVLQKLLDPVNVENGTASRMLLSIMPATNYEYMPWFDEQKKRDCTLIYEAVERLQSTEEVIDSKVMIKAFTKWSNEMAERCRAENDVSRDMLRRRSGIIGQTASVLYALVDNKRKNGILCITKNAIDFGLVLADYSLDMQCMIFRNYAEMASMKISLTGERKMTKNKVLYDNLPEEFTVDIVKELKSCSYTTAYMTVMRYLKNGLITKTDKNKYKKLSYEDSNRA